MNNSTATATLGRMIDQAKQYDDRGDVVLRDQTKRQIMDLPLRVATVKSAIKRAGL